MPLPRIDPARWAGLEVFPLSLVSDGDAASPDVSLAGLLPAGGAFAYRFGFAPGMEYRFSTGGADDGFAERAVLYDPANGQVYWGNELALRDLGLSAAAAAEAAAQVLTVATPQRLQMVAYSTQRETSEAGGDPFLVQASVDAAAPVAPTNNDIYRFVKLSNGMYFYTASEAERTLIARDYPDFRFEGPVFTGDDVAREGWVPVWRFANTRNGSYYYTASEAERQSIASQRPELRFEGEAFWVPGQATDDTTPVFRLLNLDTGGYLFTANPAEKLFALLKGGWRDEGIAFHSLKARAVAAQAIDALAQAGGPQAQAAEASAFSNEVGVFASELTTQTSSPAPPGGVAETSEPIALVGVAFSAELAGF